MLHAELTPRELDVLRLIAKGKTSKFIARELGISFKTVISHRTHIMSKLGIHNVARLVYYALKSGILPLSDDESR
jgi:DNA-binding NarL/FixJ family response regulator